MKKKNKKNTFSFNFEKQKINQLTFLTGSEWRSLNKQECKVEMTKWGLSCFLCYFLKKSHFFGLHCLVERAPET